MKQPNLFKGHIMKPKHTPGPWLCADMAVEYVVYSDGRVQARTDAHAEVDAANARLIAAAPDLLEALQSMYRMYAVLQAKSGTSDDSIMFDARRAIAKATGGAS